MTAEALVNEMSSTKMYEKAVNGKYRVEWIKAMVRENNFTKRKQGTEANSLLYQSFTGAFWYGSFTKRS